MSSSPTSLAATSFVQHLPDVVIRFDREGRVIFVNDAVLAAEQRPAAAYLGQHPRDVIRDPALAQQFGDAVDGVRATGTPLLFEFLRDGADGPHWTEYRVLPDLVVDGEVETVLAIGRDITQARLATEALRASEARYRALAEATSQTIWGTSPDGTMLTDRRGWEAFLGRGADAEMRAGDDLLQNVLLQTVHPDDRADTWAAWTHALRTETPYQAEYRVRLETGEWRWTAARAAPVRGDDGRILEWIGTTTDVTEQRDLQRALQESERRLATLVSNLPGVAYRRRDDERATVEIVSDGVVTLTGYSPHDVIVDRRITLDEMIVPSDRDRVRATVRAALDAGRPFEVTYCITRADGTRRWVWEQGRAVPAPSEPTRIVEGLIVDVTDREEVRAALERERTELSMAQRIARLGSWSWTRQAGRVHLSAGWDDIVGTGPEFIGDPRDLLVGLLAPEERTRFAARAALLDQLRPIANDGRWAIITPAGKRRVLHARSIWEYDDDGERLAGSGTFQDVTEQVAAEQEIVRQRALLEESQRMAHVGSWELEVGTNAVTWSDEMYRLAGLPLGGRIERVDVGAMMPDDDRAYVSAQLTEGIATGQDVEYEHRIVRADGVVRTILTRGRMVRGSDDTIARVVGSSQDVTEHRQLEEQVRQTQKMDALGLLAGSVAHDFNNLLSAIIGGAELARLEVPAGSPAAIDLDDIRRAGLRAAELTRQLLTFSRKQVRRPRLLDLRDCVRHSETLLRRLLPEEITLDVATTDEPCVARVDGGQIEQVALNLVVNARDAIVSGWTASTSAPSALGDRRVGVVSVEVGQRTIVAPHTTTAGGPLSPGTYVTLVVRDTGIGMSAATIQRAFEPFFTTKAEGHGTGLGLATVFGVVAQSGGGIDVESVPGTGASFTVLLPAVDAPADTADLGVGALPAGAETILLVEDERVVREMATRILERHGYHVVATRHGADAMLAWREQGGSIDALVTDLRMPAMGGQALVEQLRGERSSLPVVLMSGYASGRNESEAAMLQREIFLEKPFTAESLLVHLRSAIDRARQGRRPVD